MSLSKNVLFMLSGSISAYKTCEVISRLKKDGANVQTVASTSALEFIGEATLEGLTGHPVLTETFESGAMMEHIHAVRDADLIILAPATANKINQLANGIGQDLISTMFLAHDFKKPFLIAPAMNTSMYNHPITQESLKKLKKMGVTLISPESGLLACGEDGIGRLADPEKIYSKIVCKLKNQSRGQILLTYGGTEEPIDGVRSIGNFSTGQTGAFLCDQLTKSGYSVTVLHSHRSVRPLLRDRAQSFVSFDDLEALLKEELEDSHYDAVIHLAAVSDYSVDRIETPDGKDAQAAGKKLSSSQSLNIKLKTNKKLIHEIKEQSINKDIKLFGFKLTNQANEEQQKNAVKKLFALGDVDFVIHNDLSQINSATHLHKHKIFRGNEVLYNGDCKDDMSENIIKILNEEIQV